MNNQQSQLVPHLHYQRQQPTKVAKEPNARMLDLLHPADALTSQQFAIFQSANNGTSNAIFGVPNSGKSTLLMALAVKAAQWEKPGKVKLFLRNSCQMKRYDDFINRYKKVLRRPITIQANHRVFGDENSFDDIIVDDDLDGNWIPIHKWNSNRLIVVTISNDRFNNQEWLTELQNNLQRKKSCAIFTMDAVIQTATISRNPPTISSFFDSCSDAKASADLAIISKGDMKLRNSEQNFANTCLMIVEKIKEFCEVSDSPATYNDIVIIVAHEPVTPQINAIKNGLKSHSIPCGSIQDQIFDGGNSPFVAVDHSANALHLKWRLAFAINSSQCYFSRTIAARDIVLSRATDHLVDISTLTCAENPWRCENFFLSTIARSYFSFEHSYAARMDVVEMCRMKRKNAQVYRSPYELKQLLFCLLIVIVSLWWLRFLERKFDPFSFRTSFNVNRYPNYQQTISDKRYEENLQLAIFLYLIPFCVCFYVFFSQLFFSVTENRDDRHWLTFKKALILLAFLAPSLVCLFRSMEVSLITFPLLMFLFVVDFLSSYQSETREKYLLLNGRKVSFLQWRLALCYLPCILLGTFSIFISDAVLKVMFFAR